MKHLSLIEAFIQKITGSPAGERTQTVLSGLGWSVPTAVLARFMTGVATALAARWMGPGEFGLANLALAVTLWIQIPMIFGLPTAMMHYAPQAPPTDRSAWIRLTARSLFLTTLITTLIALGLCRLRTSFYGIPSSAVALGVTWCIAYTLFIFATNRLNSLEQFKTRSFLEGSFSVLFCAMLLVSIWRGDINGNRYVLALTWAYALAGLGGLLIKDSTSRLPGGSADPRRLWSFGALAAFGGLSTALIYSPARIIANRHFSAESLGVLSAYQGGSIQMALLILSAATQVFFPVASRTPDRAALRRKLHRVFLVSSLPLVSIFAFTLFIYFSVLGRRYPLEMPELLIFSIAALFSLFQGMFSWLLASEGRQGLLRASLSGMLAGGVNLAACLVLIPIWDIRGAGLASILSCGIGVFVSDQFAASTPDRTCR